jgi:hypothetical protein
MRVFHVSSESVWVVGGGAHGRVMNRSRRLRGIELRYALSYYLAQHGRCTIAELIDGLTHQGFVFDDEGPKQVSDALRWEIRRQRVVRVRRGTYEATTWPRSTMHRIRTRVLTLRSRARALRPDRFSSMGTDEVNAFWDSFA